MIPLGLYGAARPVASGGGLAADFVTFVTTGADATTYTFPAVPIGAANAGRSVVVAFGARSSGTRNVVSVTIGGVAASIDRQARASGSTTAFASAHIPIGTTADVVVTLDGGAVRAGIGVWRLTGGALAVAGTDSDTAQSGSLDVTVPPGGVALAAITGSVTAAPPSWTGGLSEDYSSQTATEAGWVAGGRSATGSVSYTIGGTPQAVAVAYAPA